MGKYLKSSEEKALLKAQKEKAEQDKIIGAITEKQHQREAILAAVEEKHRVELSHYNYRCETFLANQDTFTRLCWFIGHRGIHRKKFSDVDWDQIVKDSGLSELQSFINKTGTPGEQPPVKQTIDPLEDG